jgi:SPP1 gp7 family putative phage head morphogenesis protein
LKAALVETATRHQVFLERLKSSEAKRFGPFLLEIDKILRDRLTAADITEYSRGRVERLLAEVEELLDAVFNRYTAKTKKALLEIAEYESGFEARALGLVVAFETVVPTVNQIRAAVLSSPLSVRGPGGGKLLEPFIKDWGRNEVKAVSGAIRRGYFEGRTTQQIIQEIRGTKAKGYADGLMSRIGNHAEAITRTAVQHVANTARAETWAQNSDIVTGYRWVSTLDSRTSPQCRTLDGQFNELGKGPLPPIHINCRSTTVAEIAPEFRLNIKGERASINGPVDAKQTYYEWLKKQSPEFQDQAIGKTRGQLFRSGGLSAERFSELQLGKNFQPLTLDEMRKLEPLAFERAGI